VLQDKLGPYCRAVTADNGVVRQIFENTFDWMLISVYPSNVKAGLKTDFSGLI
jgi:hypothetical protein